MAHGTAVAVALVDTGVTPEELGDQLVLEGTVRRRKWAGLQRERGPRGDPVGHGSMCARAIGSVCAHCRVMSFRVSSDDGVADPETLAEGIAWAAEEGAHIISVSLAVQGYRYAPALREACNGALRAGALVLAAGTRDPAGCLPASLSSVIAVRYGTPSGPLCLRRHDDQRWDLRVDGTPPCDTHAYDPLSSSLACAIAAGLVAREMSSRPPQTPVETIRAIVPGLERPTMCAEDAITTAGPLIACAEGRARYVDLRGASPLLYPYTPALDYVAAHERRLVTDHVWILTTGGECESRGGRVRCIRQLGDARPLTHVALGPCEEGPASWAVPGVEWLLSTAADRGIPILDFLDDPEDRRTVATLAAQAHAEVIRSPNPFCAVAESSPLVTGARVPVPVVVILGDGGPSRVIETHIGLATAIEDRGYRVGHLSSRPDGALFGFDGHLDHGRAFLGATAVGRPLMQMEGAVAHVWEALRPDLIIVSCHDPVMPWARYMARDFAFESVLVLLGAQPDVTVLLTSTVSQPRRLENALGVVRAYSDCAPVIALVPPEHGDGATSRESQVPGFVEARTGVPCAWFDRCVGPAGLSELVLRALGADADS